MNNLSSTPHGNLFEPSTAEVILTLIVVLVTAFLICTL